MSKFSQLKNKLESTMNTQITDSSLLGLKRLINYDEHKFYNVSQLRSYIKNNSEPDDDDAIYCISILFEIQVLIEKYNNNGSLPKFDKSGNLLTINQLIERENNTKRINSNSNDKPEFIEVSLEEPLDWNDKQMRDYFKLDLNTFEIKRERM